MQLHCASGIRHSYFGGKLLKKETKKGHLSGLEASQSHPLFFFLNLPLRHLSLSLHKLRLGLLTFLVYVMFKFLFDGNIRIIKVETAASGVQPRMMAKQYAVQSVCVYNETDSIVGHCNSLSSVMGKGGGKPEIVTACHL